MSSAAERLAQEAQEARSVPGGIRGVKDITNDFTAASKQLGSGELVKDEFFTLFESVGALEIMDPKMDSGYVPPNDSFESDFDLSAGPDPEEALWIMDQLLCLEITWHDGYPLSQTIFTSLHIDSLISPDNEGQHTLYEKSRPSFAFTPEQAMVYDVLRTYCIGLLKCCERVLQLIQSQTFYEEEDFVTHLFGRELLPKVDSGTVLNMFDDAISLFEEGLPNEIHKALRTRLNFRKRYLETLAGAESYWPYLIQLLEEVKSTHSLARPIPEAFSEKVQRQLATSTPPRPMLQMSWDLACSKWKSLFEDSVAAQQLTSFEIIQSPACLQRAVWAFSYRGQPCALARAVLQDILFGDQAIGSEIPHYELLLTDIRDLVLAGDALVDPESFQVEVTSDPRHICSRLMEGFMDKVIDEYLNLYRMVCQNRSRIRRTFTQAIPILDTLVSEAAKIDTELAKNTKSLTKKSRGQPTTAEILDPLTCWTKFYLLRIMEWTVQLGFETDIYLSDELWMMCQFLATLSHQRYALLEKLESFTSNRMKTAWGQEEECQASLDWLKCLKAHASITQGLAQALSRFYTIVMDTKIIVPPPRDFSDPRLLYELRMKPYLCVKSVRIPTMEGFEFAKNLNDTIPDRCHAIDEMVKGEKSLLADLKKASAEQGKFVGTEVQWKREIKQLETTCVAIAVGSSQLRRAYEKYGSDGLKDALSCSPEKKYHEWWVVPQLKEKK